MNRCQTSNCEHVTITNYSISCVHSHCSLLLLLTVTCATWEQCGRTIDVSAPCNKLSAISTVHPTGSLTKSTQWVGCKLNTADEGPQVVTHGLSHTVMLFIQVLPNWQHSACVRCVHACCVRVACVACVRVCVCVCFGGEVVLCPAHSCAVLVCLAMPDNCGQQQKHHRLHGLNCA
jgi:hypothetical protein